MIAARSASRPYRPAVPRLGPTISAANPVKSPSRSATVESGLLLDRLAPAVGATAPREMSWPAAHRPPPSSAPAAACAHRWPGGSSSAASRPLHMDTTTYDRSHPSPTPARPGGDAVTDLGTLG